MKLRHTSLGFMKKDKPFPKVDDVLSPSVEDKKWAKSEHSVHQATNASQKALGSCLSAPGRRAAKSREGVSVGEWVGHMKAQTGRRSSATLSPSPPEWQACSLDLSPVICRQRVVTAWLGYGGSPHKVFWAARGSVTLKQRMCSGWPPHHPLQARLPAQPVSAIRDSFLGL